MSENTEKIDNTKKDNTSTLKKKENIPPPPSGGPELPPPLSIDAVKENDIVDIDAMPDDDDDEVKMESSDADDDKDDSFLGTGLNQGAPPAKEDDDKKEKKKEKNKEEEPETFARNLVKGVGPQPILKNVNTSSFNPLNKEFMDKYYAKDKKVFVLGVCKGNIGTFYFPGTIKESAKGQLKITLDNGKDVDITTTDYGNKLMDVVAPGDYLELNDYFDGVVTADQIRKNYEVTEIEEDEETDKIGGKSRKKRRKKKKKSKRKTKKLKK